MFFNFNSKYWYLLLRRKKCVDLIAIFKKGRKKVLRYPYKITKAVFA